VYYWNYDGMYVPTFRFDGKHLGDPSDGFATYEDWYNFVRATFDSLLSVPSPFRINLDQYWSKDMDSVYVSFDVICTGAVPDPLWLNFAVAEGGHFYPVNLPYAKRWYHAMRRMIPDVYGVPVSLSPGDSLHYNYTYPIDDIFHQDDAILVDDQWDMETVVFVQDTSLVVLTDTTGAPIDTVTEGGQIYQTFGARVRDVASVRPGTSPDGLALSKNWPNPFRSATSIAYAVPKAGNVRLSVYTAEGRLVTRLVDGYSEPGTHSATWDGRDRFGNEVGSGMYYYRLDTGGQERTGRMVFLK
jgi:hypothetical protein